MITDPAQRRATRMAARNSGRNTVLAGGGLHHIALQAADFEASLRFYCQGLGFRPVSRWEEHGQPAAMLDIGDGTYLELYGGGMPATPPQGRLLHFALRTADCAASLARAVAAGATMTMPPDDVTLPAELRPLAVRIAFCTGPDGEEIEFLQSIDL
jgi:glyoxylase I family protein